MKRNKNENGFIKIIIIIVIALIVLGYLGFDIRRAVESPTAKSNLTYAEKVVLNIWNNILKKPAVYVWKEIFINLLWDKIVDHKVPVNKSLDTNHSSKSFSSSTPKVATSTRR